MTLPPISTLPALLSAIVGPAGIVAPEEACAYESGARYGHGRARLIVRPATVEEVSQVLQTCAEHAIPLIVQGANTGLVGASTPDCSGEQVVLALTRLRQPLALDASNRSVEVGAGVTLHQLNDYLGEQGFWFPIDLGADPTVGGMVATNTGGTRLIRYGDVRRNVLALDVVLFDPPGQRLRLGKALRKDNTGPDLKQLFIGSSGSLGIVVGATLEVQRKPRQSATALVVPTDAAAVDTLLMAMEAEFGDNLAAFEGMSHNSLSAAIAHVPGLRNPFHPDPLPDFAILVELESTLPPGRAGAGDLQDLLNEFLQEQFGTLVSNAAIGDSTELWALRHALSEGSRTLGHIIAFDISVPRSQIMEFREQAIKLLAQRYPHLRVADFGHIADGGIHFNIIWPNNDALPYQPATVDEVRNAIYALVVEDFDGSFSAEHGVGPHNAAFYQRYTAPGVKALSAQLKSLFDPLGLSGNVVFGPDRPAPAQAAGFIKLNGAN